MHIDPDWSTMKTTFTGKFEGSGTSVHTVPCSGSRSSTLVEFFGSGSRKVLLQPAKKNAASRRYCVRGFAIPEGRVRLGRTSRVHLSLPSLTQHPLLPYFLPRRRSARAKPAARASNGAKPAAPVLLQPVGLAALPPTVSVNLALASCCAWYSESGYTR